MLRLPSISLPTWASEAAARLLVLLASASLLSLSAQTVDCAECHAQIAKTYAETGMGRSFSRLASNATPADFQERNSFFHAASNRFYEAIERDGSYLLRRYQRASDGREINVVEKEMHYALGSGNHAVGFLHRSADGRLLQLPVSWYAQDDGFWEMAPGYDRPDHAGFRRGVDLECMFCHNAYPSTDIDEIPGAAVRFPADLPEGIDCARCHGDGEAHAVAAREGAAAADIRAAILNPARLSPARQTEVCMQCHLETTTDPLPHAIRRVGRGYFSYSPTERLSDYLLHFDHAPDRGYDDKFEVVSAVYRLRQSRCFNAADALTCTTCHDPHHIDRGAEATARYNRVCRQCHTADVRADARHGAGGNCVACHMPKRVAEDAVHVRMTDHRILIPEDEPPRLRQAGGEPYRGPVQLYYPKSLEDRGEEELYLALAQVKGSANLEAGLPRLKRAIRRQRPKHPDFHYFLGEGYLRSHQIGDAIEAYRSALERDAEFWPAALGLGLALSAAGDLSGAAATLQQRTGEDVSVGVALGDIYYRMGRLTEARETLLAALELDPESPEAHTNLGVVYVAQKRLVAAEAEFRESIRQRPDYGPAHANLAGALLAKGRVLEAIESYEAAVTLGPLSPAAVQGYAQALAIAGREEGAREVLRRLDRDRP